MVCLGESAPLSVQGHATNVPTPIMTVMLMCSELPGNEIQVKHIVHGGNRHICMAVLAQPEKHWEINTFQLQVCCKAQQE